MGHSLIKDSTGESQNVFLETTKLMIKPHTTHEWLFDDKVEHLCFWPVWIPQWPSGQRILL